MDKKYIQYEIVKTNFFVIILTLSEMLEGRMQNY
jgi:hypothetical protein